MNFRRTTIQCLTIRHHYFDVDADVIFDVCENHIGKLGETIKAMINDLRFESSDN